MLLQAKQLPPLLSEMPRVDSVWLQNTKMARTKHFIETVGEVTEAASVFYIKFCSQTFNLFQKSTQVSV